VFSVETALPHGRAVGRSVWERGRMGRLLTLSFKLCEMTMSRRWKRSSELEKESLCRAMKSRNCSQHQTRSPSMRRSSIGSQTLLGFLKVKSARSGEVSHGILSYGFPLYRSQSHLGSSGQTQRFEFLNTTQPIKAHKPTAEHLRRTEPSSKKRSISQHGTGRLLILNIA
jgi:hypothetical protein